MVADQDELCFMHRMERTGADRIDPLELVDWTDHANAVRATAHTRRAEPETSRDDPALTFNTTNLAVNPDLHREARLEEIQRCLQEGYLRVVPDPPDDTGDAAGEGDGPLVPDVLGVERQRDAYRAAMPNLTDAELDEYLEVYRNSLSPKTARSYTSALAPYYMYAHKQGFHPLKADPTRIESYMLGLMTGGKRDSTGTRQPDQPYSLSYFQTFLAALKRAAAVQELPNPCASVKIEALTRGYTRTRGSRLPREGKTEVLPEQLVEIEQTAREGATLCAATMRSIVALGCDLDLDLSATELAALTFGDIALPANADAPMVITTHPRGVPREIAIPSNPRDPACAVTAAVALREAVRLRMRAERNGTAPTRRQIDATSVFLNARTGVPLTRKGIQHIANTACEPIAATISARRGKLPALTRAQRQRLMVLADDTSISRDMALIFHAAFSSSRASNVATFNVGHITIWGQDQDGTTTLTPLVDIAETDGTIIPGILDRIATITTCDIFDDDGASLYASGLIGGAHTAFLFGTKTQQFHQNWHPAQPGHPACPLRLLLRWLKTYDQILFAHRGSRLSADDPLFCNLKHPGEPIANMSRVLGDIVKTAMADLGHNPDDYSAHSLRKLRASYALSQGGSMTDVMVHDGRSSEPAGLVYAHRNPQQPFKGDPTVNIYNHIDQQETTGGATMPPTTEPDKAHASHPPTVPAGDAATSSGIAADIDTLRQCVKNLRSAGLDSTAISAIAGLNTP